MGDINQKLYLERFLPPFHGPVLEIGSKDYGSTVKFRKVFPDCPYTGVDMEAGDGVDHTLDMVEGTGDLPASHYGLGICCSVLEHVTKPWKMAEHITHLIRPNGRLYISVPWVWRYHAYPDDYYRFSFRGIMHLFPEFEWEHLHYSTTVPGEFLIIKDERLNIDDHFSVVYKQGEENKRKYLPYLMLHMLGTKRAAAVRAA